MFWGPMVRLIIPMHASYFPATHSWASGYLPMYGAIRAIFMAARLQWMTNAVFAAISLLALAALTRKLWPNQSDKTILATVLLTASPQFLDYGDDQLRDAGSSRAQFGLALAVLRSGETAFLAYAGTRCRRARIAPAIFSRPLRRAVSVLGPARPTLESGSLVCFGLFGRRRRVNFGGPTFYLVLLRATIAARLGCTH